MPELNDTPKPCTKFIGAHPYADLLASEEASTKPLAKEVPVGRAHYDAAVLNAIRTKPDIGTSEVVDCVRRDAPRVAYAVIHKVLARLERDGKIRHVVQPRCFGSTSPINIWRVNDESQSQ